MDIFEQAYLGNIALKNRIVRSATYEGMCDKNGFPSEDYKQLYVKPAQNNIGAIITGFVFISNDGRAMQPGQAGVDNDDKIPFYKEMTDEVHKYDCKIFMQIAHAGRQTSKETTGGKVYGASYKKSHYFKSKPERLSTDQVFSLVETFAGSARRAKQSGFDGVQIHAAHGYLVHQFILPVINNRKDIFGVDSKTGIGIKFLDMIIDRIREKYGADFPILIKVSAGGDYLKQFTQKQFLNLIRFLDSKKIAGIEISYGTMDYALNIFRGNGVPFDTILKYNPRYKINNNWHKFLWKTFAAPIVSQRIKPFIPMYNLPYAQTAKQFTDIIPVIVVGGFRTGQEIFSTIKKGYADFISLCRPFICEPDFANKLYADGNYVSKCISCNTCAVMCDSINLTKCYQTKAERREQSA
jgi:2,4-dienoyl-CoA reductase-like NADH-dependent reductase (Old Yellow Enzyme family)